MWLKPQTENSVKNMNAGNQLYLLFPLCFLSIQIQILTVIVAKLNVLSEKCLQNCVERGENTENQYFFLVLQCL